MMPPRQSPLHHVTAPLAPQWTNGDGMISPLRFDAADGQRMGAVGVADLSFLSRCGLKGPNSVAWLGAQGFDIPEVNCWARSEGGVLVARLGRTEFLVEDGVGGSRARQLAAAAATLPEGVYPVLRQDASLALTGSALQVLLAQTCSLNFKTLDVQRRQLALTSMVGVSVVILPMATAGELMYRVWCDGTYGGYLWQTLVDIARESGGGAVGLDCLMPGAFQQITLQGMSQ